MRSEGSLPELVECINPYENKWRVVWDIVELDDSDNVSYRYLDFDHKPTLIEIKDKISSKINEIISTKILTECKWKKYSIWLSDYNQLNFKSIVDYANQSGGENLPVRLKLGESDDKSPIYHSFRSLNQLNDFYKTVVRHITNSINSGWDMKDGLNWSSYEELLTL